MDDSCLPEYADARKIFLQDQELSGRVSLADLNKLDGIMRSDKGTLIANLRFFQNKSGQRKIALEEFPTTALECFIKDK